MTALTPDPVPPSPERKPILLAATRLADHAEQVLQDLDRLNARHIVFAGGALDVRLMSTLGNFGVTFQHVTSPLMTGDQVARLHRANRNVIIVGDKDRRDLLFKQLGDD